MESGLAELEKSGDARLFYVSNFGGHTGRIRGGRMKLAVLTMRRLIQYGNSVRSNHTIIDGIMMHQDITSGQRIFLLFVSTRLL